MPQICGGVTSPWILCFPLSELGGEREHRHGQRGGGAGLGWHWPAAGSRHPKATKPWCGIVNKITEDRSGAPGGPDHQQMWHSLAPARATPLLCTLGFVMLLNCYSIWQQGPHSCLAWLEPTVWWESALWSQMGWVWIPVAQPIGCVWSYVSYRASLDLSFPIYKTIVIRNKRVSKYTRGLEQPCM